MKAKRGPRDQTTRRNEQQPFSSRWLPSLSLGMLATLAVATPLLPTETVQLGGSATAMTLLWLLLLLIWALTGALTGQLRWRGGPALWMLVAFLIWHSVSAVVMARHGQPRAAINMLWQWVGFGIVFFLTRHLVRTSAERRAFVALMMALAVALSVLGYHQYFREHPLTRALYLENPEKVLRDAGIYAPAGTPHRNAFENRLFSTEPFATFALANSLAGFLAPWLVVALGIGMTNWNHRESSKRIAVATAATVLVLAGCWLLTKSRTAWLATLFGIALLAVYGRRTGWRPDWRIVTGIVAAGALLPILAYVIGGLDSFVLLEASKAMLYRVQYWRATADMIADFPLFGCGPGNFQQYYTAYKLPEASETIAEPHNFILEIWATAGTPAIATFVGFLVCLAWQVWRADRGKGSSIESAATDEPESVRAIYWGGLAGGLLAFVLCTSFEGYSLSAGLLVFGFPVAAVALALWNPWVMDGRWPIVVPAIALAVLLINLLAAGGISFASVSGSLWILAALLLGEAEGTRNSRILTSRTAWFIGLVVLIAIGGFAQVGYLPQLNAQAHISEGDLLRMQGDPFSAMESYRRAAEADRFSTDGWERLANMAHEAWLATGESSHYETFVSAAERVIRLNPRSSAANSQVGHWWLAAYRNFGKQRQLEAAIERYRIATRLYPNYNLGHAQLAWALYLAGEDSEAAEQAAHALRLDAILPHHEQKLAQQRVYDSQVTLPEQRAGPGDRTTEQVMQDLRKGTMVQ